MRYKAHVLFAMVFLVSCFPSGIQERRITVTIEPQRFFAEQLAGGLFEISTMVPPGLSPESYDPTPQQMMQLAHSRAYFAIGQIGFENVWLDRLKENNPQVAFYNNSEGLDWIDNHNHVTYAWHSHAVDPHTWSSPREVRIIVENMCQALIEIDSVNAGIYQANLEKLLVEINAIDSVLSQSALFGKSFIIYHPALTYLARDYGLKQYSIEN
jgi:zinc transport system substrate-binding protein